MNTWHIHIRGIVQGVGFRPLVYKLAMDAGIKGWVKNDLDGVRIMINGTGEVAEQFYQAIKANPPKRALIYASEITSKPYREFQEFNIIQDAEAENTTVQLTPDFATCDQCKRELSDPENIRYQYPFITCSDCGPRYSITRSIPFERVHTEMSGFKMCSNCQEEYHNPLNRRFYAQTTSCGNCGIKMQLYKANNAPLSLDTASIIEQVITSWKAGEIVAVKGVGGYLITCDASNQKAIEVLRTRKKRPHKPFALMYPFSKVQEDFTLSEEEQEEFSGPVAPIILLQNSENLPHIEGICDGLSRTGIMIPYAPLFQLLLLAFKRPIVATSGNVSNSPIIFQDNKALSDLFDIADMVLTYNRDILVPQDDSVMVFSAYFNKRIIIRRSRGLAPSYVNPKRGLGLTLKSALAMGAQLKSTFTCLHQGNIFVSQYLGDLDSYDTEQNYNQTLSHQRKLLGLDPEMIIIDLHQGYSSSVKGVELASEFDLPLLKVQHHIAHFSALLGEHLLLDTKEKILGVIWDGTGLGHDNNIWGGEFFTYHDYGFDRVDHLPYFQHITGDKMAQEPRLAAFSLCSEMEQAHATLRDKFTMEEWNIYTKHIKNSALLTSSMGRLFDGIASLTGLVNIQSYEGQAAAMLQVQAEKHFKEKGIGYHKSYFRVGPNGQFSLEDLVQGVISDVMSKEKISIIAAKFHVTLVEWINQVASNEGVRCIGFSGGVFQNTLLVDLIIHHLQDKYDLLFHKELSPNDENISFGQLIYAEINQNRLKIE